MMTRLQKHIADLGICSRRKAEELIAAGAVKVNGVTVREMGVKINPEQDNVSVDESTVSTHPKTHPRAHAPIYIALHKPIDYISSTTGTQGQSVIDLLTKDNHVTPKFGKTITERVYPVGRLDKESEGLMILTNDGTLTNQLTHPRYGHEKEYDIVLPEPISHEAKEVLEKGMIIDGERFSGIRIKKEIRKGKRIIVTVILTEGKNRQIRKMFGRLGYSILSLKRTRIQKLRLGTLPVGRWKFIKKSDIV